MKNNLIKTFVLFLCLVIVPGAGKSFAQLASSTGSGDEFSDERAREAKAEQTLNQIHDVVLEMEQDNKRLDALEKAVNNADIETLPVETVNANTKAQEAPVQAIVEQAMPAPDKVAAAPVRIASAKTDSVAHPMLEKNPEPADVMPQSSVYYAPIASYPKVNDFELSQEDFYSAFKEPGNFKKNGEFYGIYAADTFRPVNSENWPVNVFHVDVHGDYGLEHYNFLQDGKIKNANNYIVEPRAWIGKDFNLSSENVLTPFVGFGYRFYYEQLKNKFSDDQYDAGGNNIQTQYFYIPMGVQLSIRPTDGWRITMNSEYDQFVWGNMTNYSATHIIDSLDRTSPSFGVILRHGYGLRGSLKIVKEGDFFNYFLEPYVQYWNIDASNTVTVTAYSKSFPNQEDKNHTTEIGARAGLEF